MTTVAGGLGIYADDANVSNARVSVTTLVNEHGHGIATVDRAEFLRAVETELNVIVIDRADLPTVTEGPDGSLNARGATLTSDGEAYGSDALGWHAIAEHLEAHPPVDQADVDALIESIVRADDNADLTGAQIADLARRLIKAGVRPPKAD